MELSDWLLCDYWTQAEAVLLLAGINPAGTLCSGKSTDGAEKFFPGTIVCLDGPQLSDVPDIFLPLTFDEKVDQQIIRIHESRDRRREERHELARKAIRLQNLMKRSLLLPTATPSEYLEWALSKGINIPEFFIELVPVKGSGATETPEGRRQRFLERVNQEKAKGTKAFLKTVAEEEGISISRLKQLIKSEPVSQANWVNQLSISTRQAGSKQPKGKK